MVLVIVTEKKRKNRQKNDLTHTGRKGEFELQEKTEKRIEVENLHPSHFQLLSSLQCEK